MFSVVSLCHLGSSISYVTTARDTIGQLQYPLPSSQSWSHVGTLLDLFKFVHYVAYSGKQLGFDWKAFFLHLCKKLKSVCQLLDRLE